MRSLKRLVPAAAVVAVVAAVTPTAAPADPLCYSVGYTVLGMSNDHGTCVPWVTQTGNTGGTYGNSTASARVSVDFPWILVPAPWPAFVS